MDLFIMNNARRTFIKKSFIGGALGLFVKDLHAKEVTPAEIEGPFYPITPQKDTDFDLTRINGQPGVAKGKVIYIQGKIINRDAQPIEDATVDIWQANAAGKYRHVHDANPAPVDENFQGWAIVQSGREGGFNFKTIIPGAYPVNASWLRPPHIHFKVSKKGYLELLTQMYFPGQKLNETDLLLQRKNTRERALMVAKKIKDDPETYEYDIVLAKV